MRPAYPTRPRAHAVRLTAPRVGVLALIAVSLAVAAASLLLPAHGLAVLAYDPTVWLIWGRELAHLDLHTTAGPSWKPLPVVFTTAFSLFGDHAAPSLWMVVGRAGGVLGLLAAYRLGARVAGPVAGALAVAGLALESDFLTNAARGDSDALMVALVLVAIDLHLSGRPYAALAAAVGVALLRPESWPLAGAYGAWLVAGARGTEGSRRMLVAVGVAALLVLALWFIPEKLASGHFLRGAQRAREPVPGSPAQAAVPFLAVFTNSAKVLPWPLYVGAAVETVLAVRRWLQDRVVTLPLVLAAGSTVYMLIVAALAQVGFTGNPRYVIPPASIVAVLAALGFVSIGRLLVQRLGRRRAVAACAVLGAIAAPAIAGGFRHLYDHAVKVHEVARLYGELPSTIAKAGGADTLRRCGTIATGPYQTPLVAWLLHVHQVQVRLDPAVPGVVIAPYYIRELTYDQHFPLAARTSRWTIRSSCAHR